MTTNIPSNLNTNMTSNASLIGDLNFKRVDYISPTIMNKHIGGNSDTDNSSVYVKEQKKLIDKSYDTIYKYSQHDEKFDLPKQGYNAVQNAHPLGINMVSDHSNRGYDYRDYPLELAKKRESFDPYIEYMHKYGLIGKNKSQYITHYLQVDSANRNVSPISKTTRTIKLNDNPFKMNGTELKIFMDNTDGINVNDKITISGLEEKTLTLRSFVTDDYGNQINYFELNEGKMYMKVTADNNIDINSNLTNDIKDEYNDIAVNFEDFIGDTKTEWYFDTRKFIWNIQSVIDPITNIESLHVSIYENVHAVSDTTAGNPEPTQVPDPMWIGEFVTDIYGTVTSILQYSATPNADLRWTEPTVFAGLGTAPIAIPATFEPRVIQKLAELNIYNPPQTPTTFYRAMEYIQKVQNAVRPIFFDEMTIIPNSNFTLRYLEKKETYNDTVRFVVPESTKQSTTTKIGNIPLNLLNTTHRMYLTAYDIETELGVSNSTADMVPGANKFYIKLDIPYSKRRYTYIDPMNSGALLVTIYEQVKSDVKINYKHYGGIPNKLITAELPLGFDNVYAFRYVKTVTDTYITFDIGRIGFLDNNFGGNNVQIGLLEDFKVGDYQPNKYTLSLEKVYTNVVMIKMINSIFPKSQKVITDGASGGVRNNRFYWQNINDGDYVYSIELDPGNYTAIELKTVFEKTVYLVKRVIDGVTTNINNYITMDIDVKTDKVTFANYNEYIPNNATPFIKKLSLYTINQNPSLVTDPLDQYYIYPNGGYYLANPLITLDNDGYVLRINHPNHRLSLKDKIIIEGSLNYKDIPSKYINKEHIIYNITTNTYDIVLTNVNLDSSLPNTIEGGVDIHIYAPDKFRIRFDYDDTFGTVLGFRNVGEDTSITPYAHIITNDVIYENESLFNVIEQIRSPLINVSSISNPSTTNLNLSTTTDLTSLLKTDSIAIRNGLRLNGPSYLIIKCKELDNIKGTGYIKDFFYKIGLPGRSGRYVYDTYIDSPIFYNEPLRSLRTLTIDILTPDGEYYDFNNLDHSFVLEIVTFEESPEKTNLSH